MATESFGKMNSFISFAKNGFILSVAGKVDSDAVYLLKTNVKCISACEYFLYKHTHNVQFKHRLFGSNLTEYQRRAHLLVTSVACIFNLRSTHYFLEYQQWAGHVESKM
jgi:hypothetical protein